MNRSLYPTERGFIINTDSAIKKNRLPIARYGWLIVLMGVITWGCILRFKDISDQQLGGDEIHSIHVAQIKSFREINTYYGKNDNSIPMTLYLKALMTTVGADEILYRLPVILSGILILLLPLLFHRLLDKGTLIASTALIAISPLAIYYSICARPYNPAALSTALSLYCWYQWMQKGGRRWYLLFAVLSALAVYLHILSALAIGSLFIIALYISRRSASTIRDLAIAALVFGIIIIALLGPGFHNLLEESANKSGKGDLSWFLLIRTILLSFGFVPGITIALLLCMTAGLIRLWKNHHTLFLGIAGMIVAQVTGLLILKPVDYLHAWSRYLYFIWPIVLILCGLGIGRVSAALWKWIWHVRTLVFLLVVVALVSVAYIALYPTMLRWFLSEGFWLLTLILLLFSPILVRGMLKGIVCITGVSIERPRIAAMTTGIIGCLWAILCVLLSPFMIYDMRVNNFRTWNRSLMPTKEKVTFLPHIYKKIMEDPETGDTILEYPSLTSWSEWYLPIGYQHLHGKKVKQGWIRPNKLRTNGIRYRNIVDIKDENEIKRAGVKYMVVHLDYKSEMNEMLSDDRIEATIKRVEPRQLKFMRNKYGPPIYSDRMHKVFRIK